MRRQGKSQHFAPFFSCERGRVPGKVSIDKVPRGVDEAVLPADRHIRKRARLLILVHNDGRYIHHLAVSPSYPDDAFGTGDLDTIILRVLIGFQ